MRNTETGFVVLSHHSLLVISDKRNFFAEVALPGEYKFTQRVCAGIFWLVTIILFFCMSTVLSKSLAVVIENLVDRVTALEARLDSLNINTSRTIRQVSALEVPIVATTRRPLFDTTRPDIRTQLYTQRRHGTCVVNI